MSTVEYGDFSYTSLCRNYADLKFDCEQTKQSRTKESRIAKYSQKKQSQTKWSPKSRQNSLRQNGPQKADKTVPDKIVRTKQRVKHIMCTPINKESQ